MKKIFYNENIMKKSLIKKIVTRFVYLISIVSVIYNISIVYNIAEKEKD